MLNFLLKKLKLKNDKTNKNHVSLAHMPDVVMEEILDRLDYRSVLRLRKVSRGLRYTIDQIKPDFQLRKFHLHIRKFHPHRIPFQIWIGESQKRDYIDYRLTELGCTVGCYKEHQYKERSFRNTDFMNICMRDFENFMKFQRSILEVFYVNLYLDWSLTMEKMDSDAILDRIRNSNKKLLKTEKLEMEVRHEAEAKRILSLVYPNFLKSITIYGDRNSRSMSKLKIDELEVLEQWKNAENLKIWGFEWDEKGVESLVGQFSMVKLNTEVVIMNDLVI
ncbi:hypothetical protein CAEBREN_24343 [Caenorhabditis brenneri]|uniref:F-box domain-containing protein n=1 Tax=Caenorhabditis brenneri TaxID=135651 RepID=G0P389_CAEBE|nr:hypothetical protein CAEBREN_24343 [Caenorhabditis brenneri]